MGDTMEESKFYSDKKECKNKSNKFIYTFITKVLICLILFVCFLIVIKMNPKLKDKIHEVVYEDHFSFAYVNNLYKKYFGSVLPFESIAPTQEVFNEKITYEMASIYKDGAELEVGSGYLVPVIESGIVVFIGEKEWYGNTLIVQQVNGIDVWYGNVISTDIKIYDYIEKGTLLGEVATSKLYLVFQKEGKYLNYKEYI